MGRYILAAAFIFSVLTSQAANPKYLRVLRTNSYVVTQAATLEEIRQRHPKLAREANEAEKDFKKAFGHGIEIMESYLRQFMGKKLDRISSNIHKQISLQKIKKRDARDYINTVIERAKGNMPSPILETLLTYNYSSNPEQELTAGYSTNFYLFNQEQNQTWRIVLPQSWKQESGARQGVIRDFISDYGDGLQFISFEMRDLDLDSTLTDSVKYEKIKTEIVNNLLSDSKVLSTTMFDNQDFLISKIESTEKMKRYGVPTYLYSVRYFVVHKNQILIMHCGTGSISSNTNLERPFERYRPLFDLVAASVKVNTRTKS